MDPTQLKFLPKFSLYVLHDITFFFKNPNYLKFKLKIKNTNHKGGININKIFFYIFHQKKKSLSKSSKIARKKESGNLQIKQMIFY